MLLLPPGFVAAASASLAAASARSAAASSGFEAAAFGGAAAAAAACELGTNGCALARSGAVAAVCAGDAGAAPEAVLLPADGTGSALEAVAVALAGSLARCCVAWGAGAVLAAAAGAVAAASVGRTHVFVLDAAGFLGAGLGWGGACGRPGDRKIVFAMGALRGDASGPAALLSILHVLAGPALC